MTRPAFDHGADLDLLNHYQAAVPADLRKQLLERLETQLPARRINRRHLLGAVGLAAAVALAAWLAFPSHEAPNKPIQVSNPPTINPKTSIALALPDSSSGHTKDGGGDFAEEIPAAPLIVRARISGSEGTRVEYAVERIIFGTLADKTLKIDAISSDPDERKLSFDAARSRFVAAQDREPTPDELLQYLLEIRGYTKGREIILFLRPLMDGFEVLGGRLDNPPTYSLDAAEEKYDQLIRDGHYPVK